MPLVDVLDRGADARAVGEVHGRGVGDAPAVAEGLSCAAVANGCGRPTSVHSSARAVVRPDRGARRWRFSPTSPPSTTPVSKQGRAPRPSAEILAGIAGALRLTDVESEHLHVLAGTAPTRTGRHRRDVRPSVLASLERLPHAAGLVMSASFEVLAWKDLAAVLMEDFSTLAVLERNLARRAFLTPQAEQPIYGITDAAEFRRHVVMELRSTIAPYRSDPVMRDLVDELVDRSSEFAGDWERHDVEAAPMLTKTFDHPVVGPVTVDCDSLTLADRDQHLVLYTAPAGSRDADALVLLDILGVDGSMTHATS